MTQDGWADIRKKAVLVNMLTTCIDKDRDTMPLNHFVLDMQSLDVLRDLTGFDHHEDWRPDVTSARLANSSLSGWCCTEDADKIHLQKIIAEDRKNARSILMLAQQPGKVDAALKAELARPLSDKEIPFLPDKKEAIKKIDSSTLNGKDGANGSVMESILRGRLPLAKSFRLRHAAVSAKTFANGTSSSLLGAGKVGVTAQMAQNETAHVDDRKEQSFQHAPDISYLEYESASETSSSAADELEPLQHVSWRSRLLASLTSFLGVAKRVEHDPCEVALVRNTIHHCHSAADVSNLDGRSNQSISDATLMQVLFGVIGPPFSFQGPHDSLPHAIFHGLTSHASNSAEFPLSGRIASMELSFYHAMANLLATFVPSSQSLETRRIPITKARSILSIGVIKKGFNIRNEDQVDADDRAKTDVAESLETQRFLICQSRQGLHVEVANIILSSQDWENLTLEWGHPDAAWKGHLPT
jgi:hypothetical protein